MEFNEARLREYIDGYHIQSVRGKIVAPMQLIHGKDICGAIYRTLTPLRWKLWHQSFICKFWWRHWGCKPYLFYTGA